MKSLTKVQLDALLAVAGTDALMFRVMFNHGLRVSEVISLNDSNIVDGHLVIQRLKGSEKTTQRILSDEQELLTKTGRFFPMSRWTVNRRLMEYGVKAGIPEHLLHAHPLKHTTGRLAYKGGLGVAEIQSILGHKCGGNSMIYMQADENEAFAAFAAAVGK